MFNISSGEVIIPTNSTAILQEPINQFTYHPLSFNRWENYEYKLQKSWFQVADIEEAVHKILWWDKVMWEFYHDNSGRIYSTEEFEKYGRDEWFIKCNEDFDDPEVYKDVWEKRVQNRGRYILPPQVAKCIENSKSAQIILATVQDTNNIVGTLFSYVTDFETAFDREFMAHYGHSKVAIQDAIIRQHWYMPEEFLVFSSIWMKNRYTDGVSMKAMFKMMAEWGKVIITSDLSHTTWIAEMNKWSVTNNWFFRACKKKLGVTELDLLDKTGYPTGPRNNMPNYNSTMTIFDTSATIRLVAGWLSSVLKWKLN